TKHITQMARGVGLEFNLEQTVLVNTRKAHLLIQYAKEQNCAEEAEERLFKAYFTEGLNLADDEVLDQLAGEIGLDGQVVQGIFEDQRHAYEMRQDNQGSRIIGVPGIPFFVFDGKYAISGAQTTELIVDTLHQANQERSGASSDNPTHGEVTAA